MDNGNYTYERPGDPDLDSRKAKDVLLYAILIILSLVTVVGNAMVMVAVCLVPKLQRPENLLIISLAIADELIGIVVMPVAAVYEVRGAGHNSGIFFLAPVARNHKVLVSGGGLVSLLKV